MAKTLQKMTDVPANERTNLLKEKLAICSVVYDFLEPETPARDMKRQVLLECIEYISKKNVLNEAVYADALHMVRGMSPAPVVGMAARAVSGSLNAGCAWADPHESVPSLASRCQGLQPALRRGGG